jgi:DNA-binding MarR family transcriptional regulator
MSEHPTVALNETVHQRHRLGILTIAAESNRVDFGYLKKTLDMTAGNLSRHIGILEEAGMVRVEKGYEGKRPRTWVSITGRGQQALVDELAVLRALVAGVQRAETA